MDENYGYKAYDVQKRPKSGSKGKIGRDADKETLAKSSNHVILVDYPLDENY